MNKASIIIVSKNNESEIEQVFQSLASQEYRNFEVILIDLCSTDRTIEKAKFFPVKIFRLGLSDRNYFRALNSAISLCLGNNVFCLSADNIPRYKNFLSCGMENLRSEKLAMIFGPIYKQKEAPLVRLITQELFIRPNHYPRRIDKKSIYKINAETCAFRKEIWQFKNFPEGNTIDFWNWVLDLMEQGYLFFQSPALTVDCKGKTGLINHLKETIKRAKLFEKVMRQKEK